MTDTIRIWTRRELEESVRNDPNERTMLRLLVSPAVLLGLMDFLSTHGDRVEMLSAYGDPERCELKVYRRDEA